MNGCCDSYWTSNSLNSWPTMSNGSLLLLTFGSPGKCLEHTMSRSHHRSNYLNIWSLSRHQNVLTSLMSKLRSAVLEKCILNTEDYCQVKGNLVTYPKTMQNGILKKCIKRVSKFDSVGVNQTLEINNMWSDIKLFDMEYEMLELWGFSIGHIHCCGRLVSELRELSVGIFCLRYRGIMIKWPWTLT